MDEEKQVQLILDAAQNTANGLSLEGKHLVAANVIALIQLARVMWTRLRPPAPAEEAPPAPPEERRHLESI